MTNIEPYEECLVTVDYAPIRPAHETMVLSGFQEFGNSRMIFESSFGDGKFAVSVDPYEFSDEQLILEATKATLNEVYGPVAAAWAKVSLEWL